MKIVELVIPAMGTCYMMHLDEGCRIDTIGYLIYHPRTGKFLPGEWTVDMAGVESGDTLVMLMGDKNDGDGEG